MYWLNTARFLHDDERDQLEVVESRDGVNKGGCAGAGEKAVDVLFFLQVDHGPDAFGEEVGIRLHVPPVLGVLVETVAGGGYRFALVGERELIAEIVEAIVDRRSREHEDLRLHALANHPVEKLLVACLVVLVGVVVSEVVRLVDDDQIVIPPVDAVEGDTHGLTALAGEVGMSEDIVVEAVLNEDVGGKVTFVVEPVLGELLGAKNEHRLVPEFVIFDDGESGEGFPEADAVGEDTAVERLQLVDDAGGGVSLEVEEFFPDQRVLVTGAVVGQNVLGDVAQKFLKNIKQHQEVDPLRGVLLVNRGDVIAETGGDIFQLRRVRPNLVEKTEVAHRHGCLVALGDEVRNRVAALVAKINGGEPLEGHVNRLGRGA